MSKRVRFNKYEMLWEELKVSLLNQIKAENQKDGVVKVLEVVLLTMENGEKYIDKQIEKLKERGKLS